MREGSIEANGFRFAYVEEGEGHFVQREQPELLSRLILDWVGAA